MNNTFSEGDLVEATKGEAVLRGRAIRPGTTDRLALSVFEATPDRAPFIQWLETHGWTFRTIEKAAPELPTEPGNYAMEFPSGDHVYTLTDGIWWDGSTAIPAKDLVARLKEAGGVLNRLRYESGTARRVIDRLAELDAGVCALTKRHIATLVKEFGVTL